MDKDYFDKVQDCFEAALAVPMEQRTAFLYELCGGESQLYEEVKGLLDTDGNGQDTWLPVSATHRPSSEPRVDLKVGDTIGPHEVIEQIGVGGMGVVFKARDTRLERFVALKFLPAGMNTDALARQRFMIEARAASRLDHPNICIIHDVAETPEGHLYITMPYYEGETLAKRINRGSLPVAASLNIAMQVSQGLSMAHSQQIVHRDIKPANIMLTREGGVKILDFGIAKVENVNLTTTGMNIGTVSYMAPEQLTGEQVDVRTDVWALGVVLLEMLTGKQIFTGKTLPDVLQTVFAIDDVLHDLMPDNLPESVREILQASLCRQVSDRFPDMPNMHEALNAAFELIRQKQDNQAKQVPVKADKERSYDWDDKVLAAISDTLVPHIGPIAPTLVRRMSKTASDVTDLSNRLMEYLPDQQSAIAFKKQLENKILLFTTPPAPRALKTDGSLGGVDISPAQFVELEALLVPCIGPIAGSLIKRVAQSTSTLQGLCSILSDYLESEAEKQVFLKQAGRILALR